MRTSPGSTRSRRLAAATLLSALCLASLGSCGKAPRIEGRVFDQSGAPLESVTVSIANTRFTTRSDKAGRYALDYVPGSVVVRLSRDGYLADSITVSVAQKVYFPARDSRLIRIPTPQQAIAMLEDRSVDVPVVPSDRRTPPREFGDFPIALVADGPEVPARSFSLVCNADPEQLVLVRLREGGRIGTLRLRFFERRMEWDRIEARAVPLAPGIHRYDLALEPGPHALVVARSNLFGVINVERGYAFRVVESADGPTPAPARGPIPELTPEAAKAAVTDHATHDTGNIEVTLDEWGPLQSPSETERRIEVGYFTTAGVSNRCTYYFRLGASGAWELYRMDWRRTGGDSDPGAREPHAERIDPPVVVPRP